MSVPAASIIAALVGVLGVVITTLVTGHREKRQVRTAHIQKQLDELYAPIHLYLGQDRELGRQAKEGMPDGTHLLDKRELIAPGGSHHVIAAQIVAVNKKIVDILEAKSGLSQGKAPDSFGLFAGHHYMLQRAVEGESFTETAAFRYFPAQFETDIETGYDSLIKKRDKDMLPWYQRYWKKGNA